MTAWTEAEEIKFRSFLGNHTRWFDNTNKHGRRQGIVTGADAIVWAVRKNVWEKNGRNPRYGLAIHMTISDVIEQALPNTPWHIVSCRRTLVGTGTRPYRQEDWTTYVMDGQKQIVLSTTIRSKSGVGLTTKPMALSLDYTGYPIPSRLRQSKLFYEETMGLGVPYSDTDWYGYWSVGSVFGIYRSWPKSDRIPRPYKTNGYASFWVANANEVYSYLQKHGSTFPLISAINDRVGIDVQPGYTQVVATDSEGNVVVFTEYPNRV
jgi:hypothetical protein